MNRIRPVQAQSVRLSSRRPRIWAATRKATAPRIATKRGVESTSGPSSIAAMRLQLLPRAGSAGSCAYARDHSVPLYRWHGARVVKGRRPVQVTERVLLLWQEETRVPDQSVERDTTERRFDRHAQQGPGRHVMFDEGADGDADTEAVQDRTAHRSRPAHLKQPAGGNIVRRQELLRRLVDGRGTRRKHQRLPPQHLWRQNLLLAQRVLGSHEKDQLLGADLLAFQPADVPRITKDVSRLERTGVQAVHQVRRVALHEVHAQQVALVAVRLCRAQ